MLKVELEIFSPRWGRNDTYTLAMTRDSLLITMEMRSAGCIWRENLDPEWSGESLVRILGNDSICPPAIFQDLIEHAWKSWRMHELDDSAVNEELQAVAKWLNEITERKPRSEFWRKYF